MTVSTLNHRSVMSRSAARRRGTTDATAIPVTVSAGSRPCNWSSWLELQGELVGRAVGDGRHPPVVEQLPTAAGGAVAGGEQADDGLGVAHVDGDQHVASPTSSPMSRTGAEWVRAPTEIRSAPAAA